MPLVTCPACHQERDINMMHAPHAVPPVLADRIRLNHDGWSPSQAVCEDCVKEAIADDAIEMLEADMGGEPLNELQQDVVQSIRTGNLLSGDMLHLEDELVFTRRERIAHRVADTIGTFRFSVFVFVAVIVWLSFGTMTGIIVDNPAVVFGSLSGALGTLAAIQNPIILMSQRWQSRRDRLRNENDYRINLKSELEVRYLSQKIDHLLNTLHAQEAGTDDHKNHHHTNPQPTE